MAEWFAPKRYGLGSGLPIAWQGWLVLSAYIAAIIGALLFSGERNPAALAVVGIATATLLVISAKTTRGGWRWRWGDADENS